MTIRNNNQNSLLSTGENEQTADEASFPSSAEQGKSLETLVNEAQEIISSQIDPMMREALQGDPEKLAEWDALMQQCAEAAAADEREAEEEKVAEEIREHMNRVSAEMDRLDQLDPTDLEVNEGLARTIAAMHELDEVMRAKCGDYPAELANWEDGVMAKVRLLEAMFNEAREAENANPAN
jgi:DNA repair ATPase RecN